MPEGRFQCPECNASFAREGNLHRHARIHSPGQHFVCDVCLDSFARVDALTRHTAARHPSLHGPRPSNTRATRVSQACSSCSRSKLRCDGRQPSCQRCTRQQQVCEYPPRRRRQTPAGGSHQISLASPSAALPTPSYLGTSSQSPLPDFHETENLFGSLDVLELDDIMDTDSCWPADLTFIQQLTAPANDPVAQSGLVNGMPLSPESLIISDDERCLSPKPSGVNLEHRRYLPQAACAGLSFPDLSNFSRDDIDQEDAAHVQQIDDSHFAVISSIAEKLQHSTPFPAFQRLMIPPAAVMNVFVQLYFDHFHPIFPILHQPSFCNGSPRPLLVFAAATIGSRYSQMQGANECALAMTELLRRLSMYLCESDNRFSRQISMIQSVVLSNLSSLYSGDRRMMEVAEISQSVLPTLGRRTGLFQPRGSLDQSVAQELPLEKRWSTWIKEEENRRTSHAIAVLDNLFRLTANITAIISKDELRIELPSSEDMWAAPSALAWSDTFHGSYPSLPVTIRQIESSPNNYILWSKIGHLGKLSAICNLSPPYNPEDDGLDTPSAPLGSLLDFVPLYESPGDIDAPETSRRQSVEVLAAYHWGNVAQACPLSDILDLIFKAITGSADILSRDNVGSQWLLNAPDKVCHAVWHAGQIYGVVRKYHSTAFAPPAALLHAVAVLWLYSKLDRMESGSSGTIHVDDEDDPIAARNFWAQCGISQPKLHGIGILKTPGGRKRLLSEAERLCTSLKTWPTSQLYKKVFHRLGLVESGQQFLVQMWK